MHLGVTIYQYLALEKTRELALDIFYNMKAVEVQVARLEDLILESGDPAQAADVSARRDEVRAMETRYDSFLEELGVLGPDLSEEERIIMRVARMFGECELNMPDDFVREVKKYIASQREHHRARSFREELVEMLERAGVEYDPTYLD